MNKKQTIILAADHAGFALKEAVKLFLKEKGYEVEDVGAMKLVDGDDYPEYMVKAAMSVVQDVGCDKKAILFGGSGEGEAMVANRFRGVRATVWYGGNEEIIRLSREHNDANILSIGARFVDEETTRKVIIEWLWTPFSGEERHRRRNEEMDSVE